MNRGIKIGIVTFLGIAGLALLFIGLVAELYSPNFAAVVAVVILILAALVYVLARVKNPVRASPELLLTVLVAKL